MSTNILAHFTSAESLLVVSLAVLMLSKEVVVAIRQIIKSCADCLVLWNQMK